MSDAIRDCDSPFNLPKRKLDAQATQGDVGKVSLETAGPSYQRIYDSAQETAKRAGDPIPPCMDTENVGPHTFAARRCVHCGSSEQPQESPVSVDVDASVQEVYDAVHAYAGYIGWEGGDVRAVIRDALTTALQQEREQGLAALQAHNVLHQALRRDYAQLQADLDAERGAHAETQKALILFRDTTGAQKARAEAADEALAEAKRLAALDANGAAVCVANILTTFRMVADPETLAKHGATPKPDDLRDLHLCVMRALSGLETAEQALAEARTRSEERERKAFEAGLRAYILRGTNPREWRFCLPNPYIDEAYAAYKKQQESERASGA